MGLGQSLAATAFGKAAFRVACQKTASMMPEEATEAQRRLLSMLDEAPHASDLPDLARALLQPWTTRKPDNEHRQAISNLLINHIGDPRTNPVRWRAIVASMSEHVGGEKALAIVQVLKRWLTETAMREFFRAIARTTDRPDQWKQRQEFWLAYLDAGLVSDAWPALGQRARTRIADIIRESGEQPEYGVMRSGPGASSTIIMGIGDIRIAEWSDNGKCRFWDAQDPGAPKLYQRGYDGNSLRTTVGRADFEQESHVPPSPGWEMKFAGLIFRRTGVQHPTYGVGRARPKSY